MVVAMVSLMRGMKVNHGVAMTGEITLRGNVTAVGGIKEKVRQSPRVASTRTDLLFYRYSPLTEQVSERFCFPTRTRKT